MIKYDRRYTNIFEYDIIRFQKVFFDIRGFDFVQKVEINGTIKILEK